jgi:hypothetical protein
VVPSFAAANKTKYEVHVPYGLTVQEIVVLVSMGLGGIIGIAGIVFLFIEYFCGIHPVEIELPERMGKGKINVPSGLAAILVGAALLGYPLWKNYDAPPRHPVSGKIQLHRGKAVSPLSGIMVAVLPSSHIAYSRPDGGYSLDIPKGANAYQALVYFQSRNLFDLGVVKFDPNGQGNFDYTFADGSGKK